MQNCTNIAGIDLSLRATAVVVAPLDWDGRFPRVATTVVGVELPREAEEFERVERLATIAARVVRFCVDHRASEAWIESPAFNLKTSQHALGELHGVTKVALLRAGIGVRVAQVSTARKVLLGKVPRQDAKGAVQAALVAAGAPQSWSADEYDAFAVLNLALSEHGAHCFAQEAA